MIFTRQVGILHRRVSESDQCDTPREWTDTMALGHRKNDPTRLLRETPTRGIAWIIRSAHRGVDTSMA